VAEVRRGKRWLAVTLAAAAGSAIGAVARYAVSVGLVAALGPGFPWGTLAVNAAGSFAIGLYAALSGPEGRIEAGPIQQAFVVAGLCGGFTTFSIFSLETFLAASAGAWSLAAGYVFLSLAIWLIAVAAGRRAGRALGRRNGG
jgi:fluoride exporter